MKDRVDRPSGWRATVYAVALLAITFDFLQPLAHAAAMRDAAPSSLWGAFCNGSPQDSRGDSGPAAAGKHECCLGLVHATALAGPPADFAVVEPFVTAAGRLRPAAPPMSVGIRDGPHRPRGPPAFV
jgi:hypothetical protein